MYIDDQTQTLASGKIHRRVLLRTSYRDKGKVRHTTIANLSKCTDEEINALKLALRHKGNLSELKNIYEDLKTEQGSCFGAVWALLFVAKKLGIKKALGDSKSAKLILWLIFSALIAQGSRLSAVRLAKQHAVCDILDIKDGFNEDDLYYAMDWLEEKQTEIEDDLFDLNYQGNPPNFYLYDVTSSYFEGVQNELAEFGYNRDKKRGKMQIVIGLMTDDEGAPIAVEVFEGNTRDPNTVGNQIQKLADRFGVRKVTLVGDRGMIKSQQIDELHKPENQFYYITAITKPQIEKLIKDGIMQYELFDEKICEIETNEVRYVLRRNPVRVEEIEANRQSKLNKVIALLEDRNDYLKGHKKAQIQAAKNKVTNKAKQLKISDWLIIKTEGRVISYEIDEDKKAEASKFDGCYVLKTDLPKSQISAETVHDRYKGLAVVENAFRTMKTGFLEIRPIFVRKAERTRAHVFIIMLAYLIEHHLRRAWSDIDVTPEEGVSELSSICSIKIAISDGTQYQTIPKPRQLGRMLLKKLDIRLPTAVPTSKAIVHTRKTLVSERK